MPLVDYKCNLCEKTNEEIVKFPIPSEIPCPQEGCTGTSHKQMSTHSAHKIHGNNSASTPSKKFHGK